MPTRYDPDDDDRENSHQPDREISLGTGTILGIFLALALVCSLFFGLGYSMGKKSTPASPTAAAAAPSSSLFTSDERKPSPDSAASPEPASTASKPSLQVVQPMDPDSPAAPASGSPRPTPRSSPAPDAPTALPAPTAVPPAPEIFVQIAAVSRREDADTLLSALTKRGYTGLVRQAPQDKLLHIQVGPFPSKKDAETMRQRLIDDGYKPILK